MTKKQIIKKVAAEWTYLTAWVEREQDADNRLRILVRRMALTKAAIEHGIWEEVSAAIESEGKASA